MELKSKFSNDRKEYIDRLKKSLNEKSRRNIQNIINFLKEETDYWHKIVEESY